MSIIKPFLDIKTVDNSSAELNAKSFINSDNNNIPYFYIYELKTSISSTLGLVAAMPLKFIYEKRILRHELTYPEKIHHQLTMFSSSRLQMNPVLITYQGTQTISEILKKMTIATKPSVEIFLKDKNQHRLWVVNNISLINQLSKVYNQIKTYYIADGHHRISALMEIADKEFSTESQCVFLAYLIDDKQIILKNYAKLIPHLNGYNADNFLHPLEKHFIINRLMTNNPDTHLYNATCLMYLNKQWYSLKFKKNANEFMSRLDMLPPVLINNYVFNLILKINDRKRGIHIDSIAQTGRLSDISFQVDNNNYKAAFCFAPTNIKDVFAFAEMNKIFPPHTTYFEPKLPDGLICLSLEEYYVMSY